MYDKKEGSKKEKQTNIVFFFSSAVALQDSPSLIVSTIDYSIEYSWSHYVSFQ